MDHPASAARLQRAKLHRQELRDFAVADLAIHPRNAREHDVGTLHESIESNGFIGAVIVWARQDALFGEPCPAGKWWVLAGEGRIARVVDLGGDYVPCLVVDCTRDEAEGFFLADNASTDEAGYKDEKLLGLLAARITQQQHVASRALRGTGFTPEKMDEISERLRRAAGHAPSAAKAAAAKAPHAPRAEDGTVRFRLGSFEGRVSEAVYTTFVGRYNTIRGAQVESPTLLDDVLRAWLDLPADLPPDPAPERTDVQDA